MRRLTAGLVLLPILGGALAGCRGDDSAPPAPTYGECGADLATDPKVGGPLQRDTGGLEFEMGRHLRAADVGMVPLVLPAGETIIVDRVQLERDEKFAPLRLVDTFVVDDGSNDLTQTPVGQYPAPLLPTTCLRVEHRPRGAEPYLVFRVAATPGRASRNKTIDIVYHTPDGQRYVSVWLYRIYFPNT